MAETAETVVLNPAVGRPSPGIRSGARRLNGRHGTHSCHRLRPPIGEEQPQAKRGQIEIGLESPLNQFGIDAVIDSLTQTSKGQGRWHRRIGNIFKRTALHSAGLVEIMVRITVPDT